ncbi:DUF1885 family protein [Bacillus carboniphilus]|uniref:DUF1885 family protein n=1 Tax=Bacillus carboniphilus TaxID=86663 RepID=A0ABP3FWR6_9BACI
MQEEALIRVHNKSKKSTITYEDVKEILQEYVRRTKKTGEQLNWDYDQHAFPYSIEEIQNEAKQFLQLKSIDPPLYHSFYLDIPEEMDDTILRITLSSQSTHADKGKANELCRFISKNWGAELRLFNKRVMQF